MQIKKSISSFIRERDEIVSPNASNLHFNTDLKQKTMIGGLASLLVSCYVIFMVIIQGKKMIYRLENSYKTLEEQMNYEEVGQQPLSLMSKPLFEILENGDNTVDLGDDMSDSFINIRLRNIIKNYNNNTEQFEFYSNYYRMAKCEEKDF